MKWNAGLIGLASLVLALGVSGPVLAQYKTTCRTLAGVTTCNTGIDPYWAAGNALREALQRPQPAQNDPPLQRPSQEEWQENQGTAAERAQRYAPPASLQNSIAPSASYAEAEAAYRQKDYAIAFAFYTSLANQGRADAQNAVSFMYFQGQGVPQNYTMAIYWCQKAAEQGYAIAQNSLGNLYYDGQVVPKDYLRAYAWYQRSAAQGNTDAIKNLAALASKLTMDQVTEAQRVVP